MRWLSAVAVLCLVGCGQTTSDPCVGVTCGNGRCVVDQGRAACLCDEGFTPLGLVCTPKDADPCSPNPCAGLSRSACTAMNGVAVCSCPAGTSEVGGTCRATTPCSPNPCTAPHQSVCSASGGSAVCSCDPGYGPMGTGCTTTPVWDCQAQHTGAVEDLAEPDECPSLAKPVTEGFLEARSLAPAGDHDWLWVPSIPGHVYLLTATVQSGSPALLVEVFGPDGVTPVSSSSTTTGTARVHYLAPVAGPLYARVRALSLAATNTYTVMLEDQGPDDYGDDPAVAPAIAPGDTFAGAVQYPGDLDVVRLQLPSNTAVRMTAPDAGTELLVDVVLPDGGVARSIARGSMTAVVPVDDTVVLRAHGRNGNDVGPFELVTEDLGPDDHGDEEAWATPVTASPAAVPALFERPGDVDVLSFTQYSGRIYQVRCALVSYGSCYVALATASGAPVQASSIGNGGVAWQAAGGGTIYLALRGPGYSTGNGAYTWTIEDVGTDDHTELPGTPLTHGTPVQGRLELPQDVDGFTFTATAGHVMRFTATPAATGTSLLVNVYGPSGAVVGSNSASGTASVGVLATTAGTYRATVHSSYGSGSGAYTVVVTDEGTDDHGNAASSATPLTLGTPLAGELQYQSDVDVFSFAGTAGHVYTATCGPAPCQLTVLSPTGTTTALGSTTSAAGTGFLVTDPGTWTIAASAPSYPPLTNGAYTITVVDSGLEDHGEVTATATALTLAAPTSGRIGFATDKDVFSVTTTAGHVYRAVCARTSGSGSCTMRVLDASGAQLGGYSSTADVRLISAGGPLYVEIGSNYGTATYSYNVTVTDEGTDDHGNSAAAATPLTVGTPQTGALQYFQDVDVFSVSLTAGQLTEVTCAASGTGRCGITLRSPTGNVVRTIYATTTAVLGWAASTAGTWTVELSSSSIPTSYTLTTRDLGTDDHGDTAAQGTPLTVGAAATAGSIEVGGDVDVFTFTPVAQRIMKVSCASPGGRTCALTVRDPAGSAVASAYTATAAQTAFFAPNTSTYSVEVRGGSSADVGTYTVRVEDDGADDHGNSPSTSTPITVGALASGTLEYATDVDVFSTNLAAGSSHTLSLTNTSARVQIQSPAGAYVAFCYGNSGCSFTAAAAGAYSFAISSSSWSSPLGYTLTVY